MNTKAIFIFVILLAAACSGDTPDVTRNDKQALEAKDKDLAATDLAHNEDLRGLKAKVAELEKLVAELTKDPDVRYHDPRARCRHRQERVG